MFRQLIPINVDISNSTMQLKHFVLSISS